MSVNKWGVDVNILAPLAIDFGNNYCRTAIYQPYKQEVDVFTDISVGDGLRRSIRTYVAFTDTTLLVGNPARDEAVRNPHRSVCDLKRLLGRRPSEVSSTTTQLCCSVKIFNDEKGDETITIMRNSYHPEEIVAMLLSHLREYAEERHEKSQPTAVITVPACFKDSQRMAVLNSAEISGITRTHLLNETTAAAITYVNSRRLERALNVLFYDFGGCHVDASVCQISQSEIRVLGTAGSMEIGGVDIDVLMAKKFLKDFERVYGVEVGETGGAFMLLRIACERAKRILSCTESTKVEVDDFDGLHNLSEGISRDEFNALCAELFDKALWPVVEALNVSNLTVDDIDDVVVLGGCTRIPQVQLLLRRMFNQKELNKIFHKEETVVAGAAIYAAQLVDYYPCPVKIYDVVSYGVGIEQPKGIIHNIIPPNTQIPFAIPVKLSRPYWCEKEPLKVRLYASESYLGSVEISAFDPITNAVVVEVSINLNGVVRIRQANTILDLQKTGLSLAAKGALIRRFSSHLAGDSSLAKLKQRRRLLEELVYDLRLHRATVEVEGSDFEHNCSAEFFMWLAKNRRATLAALETKIAEVKAKQCRLCRNSQGKRFSITLPLDDLSEK